MTEQQYARRAELIRRKHYGPSFGYYERRELAALDAQAAQELEAELQPSIDMLKNLLKAKD